MRCHLTNIFSHSRSAGPLLLVLFILFSLQPLRAQDSSVHKEPNLDSIFNNVNRRLDHFNNDSLMRSLSVLSKEDTMLRKALSDYNLFGLAHRKRALQWNLTSSIIIFWSVIFLVFSGICFAGLQFYFSMRMAQKAGALKQDELASDLEAGAKGIKIHSPVLGVIILAISILFFYLYLQFVYPIMEIF